MEGVLILHITKNVITKISESFLSEKHFSSQKVFNTEILHFTTSIFYQIYLISFFTKKLHK
jgi:hypothetical protein